MDYKDKAAATIEVIENGPLKISGAINLTDQKRGIKTSVTELYLCRCGKSARKPYCDGSHKH
ncbi:MAG: CDGSH iron-sulfur domain-containing protein [Bacteroidetes bacterium]|nr:CDGSH iron-sulfur domain-containing protein [Bacteroidota bacterium]